MGVNSNQISDFDVFADGIHITGNQIIAGPGCFKTCKCDELNNPLNDTIVDIQNHPLFCFIGMVIGYTFQQVQEQIGVFVRPAHINCLRARSAGAKTNFGRYESGWLAFSRRHQQTDRVKA